MLGVLISSSLAFAPPSHVLTVAPGTDTLHAALEQRRLHTGEPFTLRLQAGVHRLTRPLLLDGRDNHTTFIGEAGSIVSGGIPVTGWQKSGDKWEAAVPSSINLIIGQRMQLWRGEERLTLARSAGLTYEHAEATNITFRPGDLRPDFHDFGAVQLVLYESWTASFHQLTSVDSATHTAQLATKYNAQWANQAAGSRYYVQNALEHLDTAGEFYVDALNGRVLLQLAPGDAAPDAPGAPPIVLAGPTELVRLAGTTEAPLVGVSFSGITFAHAAVESAGVLSGADAQSADHLTTAAFHVVSAAAVAVDNCTFKHLGGYAFWADAGAANCSLTNSTASDLGAGGVRLGGGHAAPSTSVGHLVLDNELSDGGHVWQQGCGVLAQRVARTTISHNEIGHFRYTGVSVGWTWGYAPTDVYDVLVSHNHIHDIGQGYLSDMGCVYTLGHQPGSAVVNNYCHDVQSYNYGGWGFYTDEGSRAITFENNVAFRTKCAGHHQHYGTDNVLQHGQSGRLGEAIAGLHGLIRLHLKAWGCPPHS